MIILTTKTTGKQAVRIIKKAVALRTKATGDPVTAADFLRVSELSRNSMWRYGKGEKPEHEGLMKIYSGLKAWDIPVEFQP